MEKKYKTLVEQIRKRNQILFSQKSFGLNLFKTNLKSKPCCVTIELIPSSFQLQRLHSVGLLILLLEAISLNPTPISTFFPKSITHTHLTSPCHESDVLVIMKNIIIVIVLLPSKFMFVFNKFQKLLSRSIEWVEGLASNITWMLSCTQLGAF